MLRVSAIRFVIVMLCDPSIAVCMRLTAAFVESRLPPGRVAAFVRVPTHSASALKARPKPSPPPRICPLPPSAAIAIDSPVSIGRGRTSTPRHPPSFSRAARGRYASARSVGVLDDGWRAEDAKP